MDVTNVGNDIKNIEQEQENGLAADAYIEQEHTAEEEAANRAAAELQERKKRRKRRNRILVVLVLVLAVVGVVGYRRYQAYQETQAEEEANVLALADGEELTYGEITQVVGNDITVAVVEEDTSSSSEDVNAKASDEGAPASDDSSANISTENMDTGNDSATGGMADSTDADDATDGMPAGDAGGAPSMPNGGDATDGMPANSSIPGEISDGGATDASSNPGGGDATGGAPTGGSMPGGTSDGGSSDMPAMPSGDNAGAGSGMPGGSAPSGMGSMSRTTYTETGETKEYQIPVGTEVTTMLGATTTFAKLKTGNVIGIVTQAGTDNILRIKIVQ